MRVNGVTLRDLRVSRHWSQDELAQLSGLNLRTIHRLEAGANPSAESLRALAAVFEVSPETLLADTASHESGITEAILRGFTRCLDFQGSVSRGEFWWFVLAVCLLLGVATLISQPIGLLPLKLTALAVLVPWVAACTRRLRDSGLSPWWQLMSLVPVAGLALVLYLLTLPTAKPADTAPQATGS